MTIAFRCAEARDVVALVPLVESAYRGEGSKLGWTTEAELLDGQRTDAQGVLSLIVAPSSAVMLAFDPAEPDVLLACAHIQMHDDGCHFGMFAVRPSLQRGGVGKALLMHCEAHAATEFKAQNMVMWVIWSRAELIAFYERRGYVRTGAQAPFPYGDPRFGLPKRDDLYFIVLNKELVHEP